MMNYEAQNQSLESLLKSLSSMDAQEAMKKTADIIDMPYFIKNYDFDTDFFNWLRDNGISDRANARDQIIDDEHDDGLKPSEVKAEQDSFNKLPLKARWVELNNYTEYVPLTKQSVKAFIKYNIKSNRKLIGKTA